MKFSFGHRVLAAVLSGIFVGVVFGPLSSILKPIASVFGMLLQMVVLPYICFSIIHGLGSILPQAGLRLFKSGWPFFLGSWIFSFGIVFFTGWLLPLTNPVVIGLAPAEEPGKFSQQILKYIVPENFFYDLANDIVPAIAVFGMIIGTALMLIEKKEPLCSLLERMLKVFEKILGWLAVVSPIGVFAQIAVSVGTVRYDTVYQFEFYIGAFILISLFTTFVILPLLLCSLTPMSYKEMLRAIYEVCLASFATGIIALMIPFLIAYLKRKSESTIHDKKLHEMGQTLLPIGYCFGQIGNCIVVLFLLFLSFYYRHPFQHSESVFVSALSFPMAIGSFSNAANAVSFLVSYLHFPSGADSMFVQTSLITIYFQALMSSAAILAIILLTMHAYYGILNVQWRRLGLRVGSALVAFIVFAICIKPFVHLGDHYTNLYLDLRVSDVIEKPVPSTVYMKASATTPRSDPNVPLSNILQSGVLKVGYSVEVPFCYFNNRNELSGYDISFMYQLASDLDSKVEFVPMLFNDLAGELDGGLFDIAVSSVIMTEERIKHMDFTQPYDQDDNVLIVPLHTSKEFLNLDQVAQKKGLVIGSSGAYIEFTKRHFPGAKIVDTLSTRSADFFKKPNSVDAIFWGRTSSIIWCLMNPGFTVVDYQGKLGRAYLTYAVRYNSPKFISFLNNWLQLKKLSGFQQEMRNYWFEGESTEPAKPRWSVLRNLLHVGE